MLIWIGKEKGMEGIPGIPGRDLTDEEVEKFGEEFLLKLGLWEKPKPGKKEPINHTTMLIGFDDETKHENVYYADYPIYEHMPDVTKSPETKREWKAWWNWKNSSQSSD